MNKCVVFINNSFSASKDLKREQLFLFSKWNKKNLNFSSNISRFQNIPKNFIVVLVRVHNL